MLQVMESKFLAVPIILLYAIKAYNGSSLPNAVQCMPVLEGCLLSFPQNLFQCYQSHATNTFA